MVHKITTNLAERLYVSGRSASVIQTTAGISLLAGVFTLDFSVSNNFNLLLTGTSVLAAPINSLAGQSGMLLLTQDTIGNQVMSFDAAWRFPNGNIPSLSTAVNAVDGLCYMVRVGGPVPIIVCQLLQAV